MMQRYLNIIEHFGYRKQMKKLHEEVFELNEAIDAYEDYLAFGRPADDTISENIRILLRDAIVNEMADVLTLCTQFIGKYDICSEEINSAMDFKLTRTEDRIETGYYDED